MPCKITKKGRRIQHKVGKIHLEGANFYAASLATDSRGLRGSEFSALTRVIRVNLWLVLLERNRARSGTAGATSHSDVLRICGP